jgi:hypothetical protein
MLKAKKISDVVHGPKFDIEWGRGGVLKIFFAHCLAQMRFDIT